MEVQLSVLSCSRKGPPSGGLPAPLGDFTCSSCGDVNSKRARDGWSTGDGSEFKDLLKCRGSGSRESI